MRIVIAVLFMLLLASCCHTRTSEEAYAQGNYLESIHLLALDIEQAGPDKFNQDKAIKLHDLVENVMVYYETVLANTAKTDFDSRIMTNNKLSEMRARLSNHFYSQELGFFLDKYTAAKLNENIAKAYYDQGHSIIAHDSADYKKKADLYQKGLSFYNYKDIARLFKLNNTKYMQLAAKEFYDQGKNFVRMQFYKNATEAFQNAALVYKPLGKYKDSEKLASYYDKLYRMNEAKSSYQLGEKIASYANSRAQYRQAAENYNAAAQVYRPYGNYHDAAIKAADYAHKGKVSVAVRPYEYENIFRDVVRIYDYISVGSGSDIYIDISSSEDYADRDKSITNDSRTEKEQKYNIKTETLMNSVTITTDIRVSGLLNYSHSFKVEKTSSQINYSYSGDVPSRYHDYSEGYLRDKYMLTNEAREQQKSELQAEFSKLVDEINKL
jgi:hypothetical protein